MLEVDHLVTRFELTSHHWDVVDDVSISVGVRETVALVGESGSGKSMTLRSIVHALPQRAAIVGGAIRIDGQDFTRPSRRELRATRGRKIGMIFQDPISALNPVVTVGTQIMETLKATKGVKRERDQRRQAIELLRVVGVPEPDRRLRSYPHELSGGMAQRVVIALALIPEPKLLLADEPTSALDVTVQAQILRLLIDIQRRFEMSILLVTHDLGVVAQTSSRAYVMYSGQIVEEAVTKELFARPRHPYTIGLLASIPTLAAARPNGLPAIQGGPPVGGFDPEGCRFEPRCFRAEDVCRRHAPLLEETVSGGRSACFFRSDVQLATRHARMKDPASSRRRCE